MLFDGFQLRTLTPCWSAISRLIFGDELGGATTGCERIETGNRSSVLALEENLVNSALVQF
jgi:hypothetical protein